MSFVKQNVSAAEDRCRSLIWAPNAARIVAFLKARKSTRGPARTSPTSTAQRRRSPRPVDLVLVIDDQFADDFGPSKPRASRSSSTGQESPMSLAQRVRAPSTRMGSRSHAAVLASGASPGLLRPLCSTSTTCPTPAGRSALRWASHLLLLFATLSGGLHLRIDSTAGERERKSLEPLLTLPVSRTAVLLGKYRDAVSS